MNKKAIRDSMKMLSSILFFWVYIPHLVIYLLGGGKSLVKSDMQVISYQVNLKLPSLLLLLFLLHNNAYFRVVFYHRIGPVLSALLEWYRPGDKHFIIGKTVKIGKSFWFAHPYGTVLAADSIGDNFRCIHLTTLGNTSQGRPTIGNNVDLGANVTIIGPVHIGNNVTIGAGSVVVKDIPDNCVAVGNPCKPIKSKI